ncbi:hypothetical protein Hypma_011142 [Hypsizygus marmoreus]|uniref:Uncharacterized protein n=1 Tax=Hypsizygus marmoreus TaxID=39966 RepID=A0A369JIN0_HYPMA|nr:hypothetical protein Hypma_011142 [Hypsizygus marmoreus]
MNTFTGIMAFITDGGGQSIRVSQCDVAYLGLDFYFGEDITGSDVSCFLECWSGEKLKVSNCPRLDDITLRHTLGNKNDAIMRALDIEDCRNVSLEGVVEMLQRLNEWALIDCRDGFLDREECAPDNLSI